MPSLLQIHLMAVAELALMHVGMRTLSTLDLEMKNDL
jgi:hypothetical protein